MGLVTPVGDTVEKFWKSLLEGRSGVRRITSIDARYFSSQIAAEILDFDPAIYFNTKEIKKTDRFVQFAVVATKSALESSGMDLSKEDPNKMGVIIGSGIGGLHTIEGEHNKYLERGPEKGPRKMSPFLIPMLIVNMASGYVSMRHNLKGPNTAVATACASGSHAIGDATRIIQLGNADVMFAGGSEAAITTMGFGGFCALRALSTRNDAPEKASRPFDRDRDGFVMGEGAGIVVLEELEHAIKRGAHIYAEIVGYGMSADACHMTAPDPQGDGAARCMNLALEDAHLSCEQVDYLNAHGTSTQLNDKIETLAIKKVFGEHAKKLAISSTKSVTGHLLGAAGGVELIACALAMRDNTVPPTVNYETPDPECDLEYTPNEPREAKIDVVMSNSLGFGGHNATLMIRRYKK